MHMPGMPVPSGDVTRPEIDIVLDSTRAALAPTPVMATRSAAATTAERSRISNPHWFCRTGLGCASSPRPRLVGADRQRLVDAVGDGPVAAHGHTRVLTVADQVILVAALVVQVLLHWAVVV